MKFKLFVIFRLQVCLMCTFKCRELTGTNEAHVGTVEHGVRVGVTRVVCERSRTAGKVVTARIVARHCNTILNSRPTLVFYIQSVQLKQYQCKNNWYVSRVLYVRSYL